MTTRLPDSRRFAGVLLGFLTLVAACESRSLMPTSDDADTSMCAAVGCAPAPLCGAGCRETCGCCACAPGERSGDLVCTSQGCYEPAPARPTDGSADGADGGGACGLPFVVGPCDALIPVYAFVDGACVPRTYGGCQGNDNRFATFEECLATCVGQPLPGACPPDRIEREICLACGPAGGCAKTATVCALVCDRDAGTAACAGDGFSCYDGVCQAAFCI